MKTRRIESNEQTRGRTRGNITQAKSRGRSIYQGPAGQCGGKWKVPGLKHTARLQNETRTQMMKLVAKDIDVAEIYSPPRVAKRPEQYGFEGGWGLDLTTKGSDGKAWHPSSSVIRKRAIDNTKKDKPLLTMGSPMCKGRR